MVNLSSEDTVTADTKLRRISTVHALAASVADGKLMRCGIARVFSSETDPMVGDAEFIQAIIEWTET